MTDQQQYDKIASLATETMKIIKEDPFKMICEGSWFSLQLLYVEMAKRGEITTMYDLPEERKWYYWNQVKEMDAATYKKIWICQSLYLFDLITERE